MITLLDHQTPPDWDWKGWLVLGGRGSGKTFGAATWFHQHMNTHPNTRGRIIAPTTGDGIDSVVEAIQEVAGDDVAWKPSAPGGSRLVWDNGSMAMVFGTPTPRDVQRLRAKTNSTIDWFEEFAANPYYAQAWKQAKFGRRRGDTRWIMTTTPRPLKLLVDLTKNPRVAVTRATSHDNPYLSDDFIQELLEDVPEGSRVWREEVLGEILEDFDGALWGLDVIDRTRVDDHPPLSRIVVGVDPATGPGLTGIVVVGQANRELYVLGDYSTTGKPEDWGQMVVDVAAEYDARVVAEENQGGAMVRDVLEVRGITTPVELVRAKRNEGKEPRAEPVALMWEGGKAHMVGSHPALEDALVSWVPGEDPPVGMDRIDAMVWACRWLHAKQYPLAGIFRPKLATPG